MAFAAIELRYEQYESGGDETTVGPALLPEGLPRQRASMSPAVSYELGQQVAGGAINNVARDQYLVQQRENFLREITATRTKARWLAWSGFVLSLAGIGIYFVGFATFSDPGTPLDGGGLSDQEVAGWPVKLIGLAVGMVGQILLILGLVLHVVATARRRRVERELPLWRTGAPQQRGGVA